MGSRNLRRQGDTTVNANIGRLRTSTRASSATADHYRQAPGIASSAGAREDSTSPTKGLLKATEKAERTALGVLEAENDDRQFDERVADSSQDLGRNTGHGAADRTSKAVKRRHEKMAAKKKAARRGTAGSDESSPAGPGKLAAADKKNGSSVSRGAKKPGASTGGKPTAAGMRGSSKGGLKAAKTREAKRKTAALAAKKKAAKKIARRGAAASGRFGPRFTPRFGPRFGGGLLKGGAKVLQGAVHAASAAIGTIKTVVAALVSTKVVLIAVVIVLVIVLLLIIIISAIPGIGHEAEREEQAVCTDAATAVTADIENLPAMAGGYRGEALENAAIIVQTAKEAGLGRDAQLIGLITAMQESNLGTNKAAQLPNGDGDAGMFQQRQLPGWYGSLSEVTDPTYAARAFFLGVTAEHASDYGSVGGGAGYGHIPGLVDIDGWEEMSPTQAASAVQKPAEELRGEYAKHTNSANEILNALAGTTVNLTEGGAVDGCAASGVGGEATGQVADVITAAQSLLDQGLTYRLGGGDQSGPSGGTIDCSAFTSYAWMSGAGIDIGRSAQDQWNNLAAYRVSADEIQPGDLIFEAWGRRGTVGDPNAVSHVAMYIGNGQMVESSRSKNGPTTSTARLNGDQFVGVARPPAQQTDEGNDS